MTVKVESQINNTVSIVVKSNSNPSYSWDFGQNWKNVDQLTNRVSNSRGWDVTKLSGCY